ncbi:MAG: DUF945 family protein [Campylobacterota bacterium]|nr:DUF945 family protein [Campylobacterota bacterium]
MKKIVIILLLAFFVIALLPIVGNNLVENKLDDRLSTLSSYGFELSKAQTNSSYLSTKKHYEFLLKDSQKFIAYLKKYSDKQAPEYVKAALEGVLVGADVEYSNIPFMKEISIDIYPLRLSKKMVSYVKEEDLDFYSYLEKFLRSKGVLYHINYNIVSEDFDGFLKDIKESHTLKDGTKLTLNLLDATYSGNGELIAPNRLISHVKKINLEVDTQKTDIIFNLDGFSSSANFMSQGTYVNAGDLKSAEIMIDRDGEDILIKANEIKVNLSSNTQGDKAELNARTSLDKLSIKSDKFDVDMKDFTYDIALSELEKDSFEKLRVLISRMKISSTSSLEEEMKSAIVEMLSYGLKLNIAQLALENITLNKTQNLEGFDIELTLIVKEDSDLAKKIDRSPLLVAENIEMTTDIKLSNPLYEKLTKGLPATNMLKSLAKQESDGIRFKIVFLDGQFKVNGKAMQ